MQCLSLWTTYPASGFVVGEISPALRTPLSLLGWGRKIFALCPCRPDGHQNNLRSSAYESLMEIVKNSAKDCYPAVQKTTLVIMERLQQVLQMEVRLQSVVSWAGWRCFWHKKCRVLGHGCRFNHQHPKPKSSQLAACRAHLCFLAVLLTAEVRLLFLGVQQWKCVIRALFLLFLQSHIQSCLCAFFIVSSSIFRSWTDLFISFISLIVFSYIF